MHSQVQELKACRFQDLGSSLLRRPYRATALTRVGEAQLIVVGGGGGTRRRQGDRHRLIPYGYMPILMSIIW